jgi:membrane-bound ClpP family serine protease
LFRSAGARVRAGPAAVQDDTTMRLPVTCAVFALACAWPVPARAQDGADALFLTVANPITDDAVARVRNQIEARVNDAARRVTTVVLDFNPDGKPASTTAFGSAYDLATVIGGYKGLTTVAFVRAPVTGHTVLPVLACKEVVMAKGGTLGPIVVPGVPSLDSVHQAGYRKQFNRDDRWPVVQKMFDPGVKLVRGPARAGGGVLYADARDAEAVQKVAGNAAPVPGVPDAQLASYGPEAARGVELAKGRAESQRELAELYGLPPLRPDPLMGRTPDAYAWTLKGDVDGAMRESVTRVIRDVRKKKGNVLILVLTCDGTDLDEARNLADELVKAQTGDDAVQVIGFVPESASDAAAVVALGCSEVVMTKPKDANDGIKEAEFGNLDRFLKTAKATTISATHKSVRELAEQQGHPALLVDAMFDPGLEVVRARARDNPRRTRLVTRKEMTDPQTVKDWVEDKVIKAPGVPFTASATLALELGLARFTVPTKDVAEVTAVYGLKGAKNPDPGWVDRFADFLRIPAVAVILVMVGFIGLILELKVPGLTVPGITAALCFVLVFWSQSRFSGEMFVLALLLFVLGLVLLGVEIFVLPGFGVCGISGILFLLAGLGLVTMEKVPDSTAEWVAFGTRTSYYLFALIGALVFAFLIAKFLPQMPGANRLILPPPADAPASTAPELPGASAAAELLGAIGTTTTALRPAGVVRFGDQFVDVVSDGGFIPTGTRVQVIAVEGTRIVVKEV